MNIQLLWEQKKSLAFNGIIFSSGIVQSLKLFPNGDLVSIKEDNILNIFDQCTEVELNIFGNIKIGFNKYFFGGGALGGDGFISKVIDEKIEWIVFFDWCSEFGECNIINNEYLFFYQDKYSIDGILIRDKPPLELYWRSKDHLYV